MYGQCCLCWLTNVKTGALLLNGYRKQGAMLHSLSASSRVSSQNGPRVWSICRSRNSLCRPMGLLRSRCLRQRHPGGQNHPQRTKPGLFLQRDKEGTPSNERKQNNQYQGQFANTPVTTKFMESAAKPIRPLTSWSECQRKWFLAISESRTPSVT